MNAAEQIRAFCSALLGGPDGAGDDRLADLRVHLWTIDTDGTKRTRWGRADQPASVGSVVESLADRQPQEIAHVYVGAGLVHADHPDARDPHARAKSDTVSGLLALHVDIDFYSEVHDKKRYPPDLASARDIWEAPGLPPTAVISTGNGVHCWWMFAEPWLIADAADPAAERDAMARLAREWSATLRYHAHRLGQWEIDNTGDLARVMRVPGTLNVRENGVTQAQILEIDPTVRYEPDELRERLADAEVLRTYLTSTSAGGEVGALDANLPAIWARVNSRAYREAGYTPPWMAEVLEIMAGTTLDTVWSGRRTGSGDDSPSAVDAALVRCLIDAVGGDAEVTDEWLVEALMCRRLRAGQGVEKVDGTTRRGVDYLSRTVGNVRRMARESALRPDASRDFLTDVPPAPPLLAPPELPPVTEDNDLADVALAALGATPVNEPAPTRQPVSPPLPPAPDSPPEDKAPVAPPPSRLHVVDRPGLWPARPPTAAALLGKLTDLLLPERYRQVGVSVYTLEQRDGGEDQKGRVMVRIPDGYQWEGEAPPQFRPGRPLWCSWYGKNSFETPPGYQRSLTRDALLPTLPTKKRQEEWSEIIRELTPYWQRDSSRSDLASQVHDWLLEYLLSHAATTEERTAVDNDRSYLKDLVGWGMMDPPTLYIPQRAFLDYVSRQPGGKSGREAKGLFAYVDVETDYRPRWEGSDGRKRRNGWLAVNPGEFTAEEWRDILDVAREAMEAGQRRKLRLAGHE